MTNKIDELLQGILQDMSFFEQSLQHFYIWDVLMVILEELESSNSDIKYILRTFFELKESNFRLISLILTCNLLISNLNTKLQLQFFIILLLLKLI